MGTKLLESDSGRLVLPLSLTPVGASICPDPHGQRQPAESVEATPPPAIPQASIATDQVANSPSGKCTPKARRSRTAKRWPRFPADLAPEDLVAIIDSREQQPLDLAPLRSRVGTLATGDYSLRGLESVIAIERKSLADLLMCVGQERDRFHREVLRLLAYPVRALVVESTWLELERGDWRSKVKNTAALGTVLNWVGMGLPVLMASDHARAGRYVSRLLFLAARRRWREARGLCPPTAR
jgi:DNA excision repair protein ERCC-4